MLGLVLDGIPFHEGPQRIPALWERFVPRIEAMSPLSVEPHGEFGVMKDFDEERKTFRYLAGLPVEAAAPVPEDLEVWTVPRRTYLAVECQLRSLMDAVAFWEAWIADSDEYEYAPGEEFEWYPPDYHHAPDERWMYYYFPIRKRE